MKATNLSLLSLALLAIYAIVLVLLFRRTGFGIIATIVTGISTTLIVWGTLHLVYYSEFLYTSPVSQLIPSFGAESFADPPVHSDWDFSWIPSYLAAIGWPSGLAYYVIVWVVARLLFKFLLRPNNSFKPTPLRGAA